MSSRSGRAGTGAWTYRKNRAIVLANSDLCGICGHGGATTADHIVPEPDWPRDEYGRKLPGFDSVENLRPAHGTMGPVLPPNPCPVCRRLCNQERGAGRLREPARPQSRDW